MVENVRSHIIEFFEYLNKNPRAGVSFLLIVQGLSLLSITSTQKSTNLIDLIYIFGIVSSIVGLVFGLEILINEKYTKKISSEQTKLIIYIYLIVALRKAFIINFDSISFISRFIIISYSIQGILFYFFITAWKKQDTISEKDKKINASVYSLVITCFFLLGLSRFNFLFFKILILFAVYGIYYLVKERYLSR
jgi:hypothetical protein